MTSEPTIPPDLPKEGTSPLTSGAALICMHFLEAAHCGTGQEGNGVKKQIQREVQTGWPTIWRRSVKGAIRSACCESIYQEKLCQESPYLSRTQANKKSPELTAAFGPAEVSGANDGQAGALKLSPASILAFPVCSQAGVFAWITCPEVFRRLRQTFYARHFDDLLDDLPDWSDQQYPQYLSGEIITHSESSLRISSNNNQKFVRLGSMAFRNVTYEGGNNPWNKIVAWFENHVHQPYMPVDIFKKRLAMVSNDAFSYLTRFATEKVQGNALDYDTKTVADGKLFSIEYLPQETLMYLTVNASDEMSTAREKLTSHQLFNFLETSLSSTGKIVQFGGGQSSDCGVASLKIVPSLRAAQIMGDDQSQPTPGEAEPVVDKAGFKETNAT
jgi:CRISPR-associated protein Cmr4